MSETAEQPEEQSQPEPSEERVVRGTGIGSMPGEDFAEAVQIVLGEAGGLPFLPELPARGATAGMVGRTIGLIDQLGLDLQPAGWRLTDAPGIDHRRATSLIGRDLDALEEAASGALASCKVQVVGPWTLAALVEKPRGDKVLSDVGARRDLAQALAEAVSQHVASVRRRFSAGEIVVQVDEPMLPAILAAQVATASGFHRHRSVQAPDAARALGWVADAVAAAGASSVLHCCAADLPFDVLRETPFEALSFDVGLMGPGSFDELADWVELGRRLWPGVVPTTEPDGRPPTDADLTRATLSFWASLGYTEAASMPSMTITPTCGLAGASPSWAREALALATRVADNLTREGRDEDNESHESR